MTARQWHLRVAWDLGNPTMVVWVVQPQGVVAHAVDAPRGRHAVGQAVQAWLEATTGVQGTTVVAHGLDHDRNRLYTVVAPE